MKSCRKIASGAPSMLDYLDDECADNFEKVKEYLNMMEIPFEVNSKIVRGLDYYSQTAFEFINSNLGAQNTLIGGGRYDTLAEQLGGKNMPGIGFAGGFERLLLSMEEEGLSFGTQQVPKVYLVALGEKARSAGIRLIMKLRDNGISAEFDPDKVSMNAQMKMTNKTGAKFALILGEDELEKNTIILKDLTKSEQKIINISDLISSIKDN
ncbi:MAG: histidine--tRNA ligase [Candidatus Cloacimonetes bacterium]|nr:histidine--tRNA ligase [Candidatus Cloacimonadota bacterium]